jgi:prepilin-type N-terminal cleavage/methylation domain-containing protein
MKPAPRSLSRRGFTIIELLVVTAIILILLALTAGAVLRYHDIQQKRNTEWLLTKLDSELRRHWNAVITQANDEALPPQILQLGGTDAQAAQRARVIYIKFRLMQEFPVSYQEMRKPPGGLQPKASYQAMLPAGAATTDASGRNIESSVLLYMALQLDRNSTKTNLDQIITNRELTAYPPGQSGQPPPSSQVKYLIDDWKGPLAFFRWPYKNSELNDPTKVGKTKQENRDLEDPNGLLSMNWSQKGAVYGMLNMAPPSPSMPYRLEPTIASAGRNYKFGLDSLDGGQPPSAMATMNPWDESDNLYSYRTRASGRGD